MTSITDRDGRVHTTKRKGVNAAYVAWDWTRTVRVAGWTTKGREGIEKALAGLVHSDDVEVFYL